MVLRHGGEGLDEVEMLILFPVLLKSWGQWKAAVTAASLYWHTCLPTSSAWLNGAAGVQEDHLVVNPLHFALGSIVCSSVPLHRPHCCSVMAQVEMTELNRAAFLAEVCLLPSKPQKHVLLEWRRLWAIYKHPGFQGFGKPFNKFLWLPKALSQSTQNFWQPALPLVLS